MMNQDLRHHSPATHQGPSDHFVFDSRRERNPGRPAEAHVLVSIIAGSIIFLLLFGL